MYIMYYSLLVQSTSLDVHFIDCVVMCDEENMSLISDLQLSSSLSSALALSLSF